MGGDQKVWPAAPAQIPTSARMLCYDSRANLALGDLMQHLGSKGEEDEERRILRSAVQVPWGVAGPRQAG